MMGLLLYPKAFVPLPTLGTGPDLVARAQRAKRALGHFGRCSAQRVRAARRAGLTGRFARKLFGLFQFCHARLQRLDARGHLFQRFPNWGFVEDFENV